MLIFLYNTLMRSYKNYLIGISLAVLLPAQGIAYFTPEDVLLSKEFFLPPTSRETQDRIQRQVTNSEDRRTREQDALFSEQHADALQYADDADLLGDVLDADDELRTAAPAGSAQVLGGLDANDLDLLKTIRLLEQREGRLLNRVQNNQQYVQYYGNRQNVLRSGAPPLAPTGAGGVLSAIVMVGAVGWTLRKVNKAGSATRATS